MPEDSGTPTDWIGTLSTHVVNVHCVCEPETAASRFLQRARHPGHLDAEASYSDVLAGLRALTALSPIAAGERIEVDTSREPELNAIVLAVRNVLGRGALVIRPVSALLMAALLGQVSQAPRTICRQPYRTTRDWGQLRPA